MKIFLVRHGRTDAHEADRKQTPSSHLGELGLKQAKLLSERMKLEQVDRVFSSKWDRAKETAEIVSTAINKNLELFDGIHEKEHNPVIYGITKDSELHKRFEDDLSKYESDLNWKFEGKGESLTDVVSRAKVFQNHLIKNHSNENVLVITHEHFIRCFMALALLGDNYDNETFYKIYKGIWLQNTGISLLEYVESDKSWRLLYVNDHLHLKPLKS